jgi:monoterpene epsilon-lactone hydrolase
MPSIRSRIFYLLLKYQKSPFDSNNTLQRQRALLESQAKHAPMPPRVDVQRITVGNLSAEWLLPLGASRDRAVLYLHGGGYTMGSCNTHRALAARISVACKTPLLLIEYRLAPEYPFPAALEDSTDAFRWLIIQGISSRKIAIAGDSAGGGLAVATTLALRDKGNPLPVAVACLSPWTDLTVSGDSISTRAKADPLISRESSLKHAAWYVGQHDPGSPLVSPINADLRGLPPMLIQVGDYEILRSDSVRLGETARQVGVDATLEVWDGMWHVWHLFARFVPEAQRAIDKIGAFISEHIDSRVDRQ